MHPVFYTLDRLFERLTELFADLIMLIAKGLRRAWQKFF